MFNKNTSDKIGSANYFNSSTLFFPTLFNLTTWGNKSLWLRYQFDKNTNCKFIYIFGSTQISINSILIKVHTANPKKVKQFECKSNLDGSNPSSGQSLYKLCTLFFTK